MYGIPKGRNARSKAVEERMEGMNREEFTARTVRIEQQLYRVSCAILRCEQDREDAMQEAMLRAWRALHTLREESYFETWMTRILINECKSLLRKKRSHTDVPLEAAIGLSQPEMEENGLYRALHTLGVDERIVLTLRFVNGYTIDETAQMLHLTRAIVRYRTARAKEHLLHALEKEAAE